MKLLNFLIFIFFVPIVSHSAIVIKTRGNRALIDLEGAKTKKGRYFEIYDLKGEKKGIIRISKVKNNKAIGVLRLGKVKRDWGLEPKNKFTARRIINRAQAKKRLASNKRNYKNSRSLLQKKKARPVRGLASYYEEENEDSYATNEDVRYLNNRFMLHSFGINAGASYNYMQLRTEDKKNLSGISYNTSIYAEMEIVKSMSLSFNLGYNYLKLRRSCDISPECKLDVHYFPSLGIALKATALSIDSLNIWIGGGGNFLYPISYENNLIENKSFNGIHGSISTFAGMDFKILEKIYIPVGVYFSVFIPPSETQMTYAITLKAGLSFN